MASIPRISSNKHLLVDHDSDLHPRSGKGNPNRLLSSVHVALIFKVRSQVMSTVIMRDILPITLSHSFTLLFLSHFHPALMHFRPAIQLRPLLPERIKIWPPQPPIRISYNHTPLSGNLKKDTDFLPAAKRLCMMM